MLRKNINRKKISENENPEKIVNIIEKIVNFNNQQKTKERSRSCQLHVLQTQLPQLVQVSDHSNIKIITFKQMLQRLPISLPQVKAGNASENLLNEIRKIIYFLYREKEVTEKIYNNIVNSIKF